MSEPVLVGNLSPEVVAEAVTRAGPGYDRWMEQVAATGSCARPVLLAETAPGLRVLPAMPAPGNAA